ncbi:nucleoside hydrolase-like domain-containing protein [Haloferula sargassicola]|uniref:DUF1593 domain-containing protein n=1 Tax=Haloferula sargassicola TaxID=490096 RepID=A0ABP9UP51_9BACT
MISLRFVALYLVGILTCAAAERPRVLVTTDGEADDRCSMVRFLLHSNDFDVEGIVNSSSQFHWQGGEGWHAFHDPAWVKESIGLYAEVYENLRLHDPAYPAPEDLLSKWKVGNISAVGEDQQRTEGAEWIAKVLLDDSDPRSVWVQAWGGCNIIARALKIIEVEHPEKMKDVAGRLRLFLIWEQDETYQKSIRPVWEPLGVTTIISDQFDCMAYIWPKVLPEKVKSYLEADWMKEHVLEGHGPLGSSYEALDGAFHAEGDTPAFLHAIPTGLRSTENPAWGGWGGRYVKVRGNVWMDPKPTDDWPRPGARVSIHNSWSKKLEHVTDPEQVAIRTNYFKPIWRWLPAVQNDFAARADWCVKDFAHANHPPQVRLKNTPRDLEAQPGEALILDASATTDPDGDQLEFRWWPYVEAGSDFGETMPALAGPVAEIAIPEDTRPGDTFHMICEVADAGSPPLTRYQRVVITIGPP